MNNERLNQENISSLRSLQFAHKRDFPGLTKNDGKDLDWLFGFGKGNPEENVYSGPGVITSLIDKQSGMVDVVFVGTYKKNPVSGVMSGVIKKDDGFSVVANVECVMYKEELGIVHYKNIRVDFEENGTVCNYYPYEDHKVLNNPQDESILIRSVISKVVKVSKK